MDPVDALKAANAEFETRLRQVTADHWERPTPCADWNVRQLVNHMLVGTRMSIHVLSGMPRAEVIAQLDDDMIGAAEDPVADFVDLAAEVVAGFAGPGGLDGMVEHPGGDFPRAVFCGFRVADATCHAWDLARAIGADETLDGELVAYAWADVQPQRDLLTASGLFGAGASGAVAEDAPTQVRYLDLMGRRP